jgi:hypothetical protein
MFAPCLEAVYAHTAVPFRVVAVAGGADPATRVHLRDLQAEKRNMSVVFVDRLLMHGEARNIALREITERFVVILENDTIVHENWLAPLLDCLRETGAAVVMPLILESSGAGIIHAAGGLFEWREKDLAIELQHQVLGEGTKPPSAPLPRMRVDYPEDHCLLIDRHLLADDNLFEDVEPFDVDLGLTLRKRGLVVMMEPRSVATYAPPPPWEVRDIGQFKLRWDATAWAARNRLFVQKWGVKYDASPKQVAYRRQQMKLGLARWYPTRFTVWTANASVAFLRQMRSRSRRRAANPEPGRLDDAGPVG